MCRFGAWVVEGFARLVGVDLDSPFGIVWLLGYLCVGVMCLRGLLLFRQRRGW